MQHPDLLRNPRTRIRLLLAILVLVCVGAVVSVALAAARTNSKNGAAKPATEGDVRVLEADVVWTKQDFLVTNQGDVEWKECKLEVNAKRFGDGYGALLSQLPAGKRATIAHVAFRTSEGATYDYTAEVPTRFTIRCRDVAGKLGAYIGTPTAR